MSTIEFKPDALEDLRGLRKFDQGRVTEGIQTQLLHEPTVETRNRKKLRPNRLAEWELRIEDFRVFYDSNEDQQTVTVVAIGIKSGNMLRIRGERFEL